MKKLLLLTVSLIPLTFTLMAQKVEYEYLISNEQKLVTNVSLYGGLLHQHQDFFNKAFSYQGVEAGTIINHQFTVSVFGATFATTLNAEIDNQPVYFSMMKAGFAVGQVYDEFNVLHTGWMVNAGYFSLSGNYNSQRLFDHDLMSIVVNGMLLSPEVYAELNVTSWIKFRTGLAWSFYNFENHPAIKRNDLQNLSVNFGFIFGNFQ